MPSKYNFDEILIEMTTKIINMKNKKKIKILSYLVINIMYPFRLKVSELP
jgi:hypothetical protein